MQCAVAHMLPYLLLQAQSHQMELYRGTHPVYLHWPRRWAMIRQEIADLSPDLVCLQASVSALLNGTVKDRMVLSRVGLC
jgi:hypothetical protein